MGMLDQENDIREFFLLLELDKPLLERQRGRIFHLAQLFKKQRPHRQLQRQSLFIVPTQGFQENRLSLFCGQTYGWDSRKILPRTPSAFPTKSDGDGPNPPRPSRSPPFGRPEPPR